MIPAKVEELPTVYTGGVRFREGWGGCCILQVEVEQKAMDPREDRLVPVRVWRDAKMKDITRQKLAGAKP